MVGARAAGPFADTAANGGGRMAADERRRQIVGVAMRLFSERGFRGTTTKQIAQAAGVSEAIIFRHFATKEDLYRAIIDYKACAGPVEGGKRGDAPRSVAESIRSSVGQLMAEKDDRAVFEHIALSMMRHHEDDTEFLRLLFYSALEGHQLSQLFWERNVRLMYEFLGAYVRERQREGAFRAIDPLLVVRAFTGMIIHHSVTNTLWDKSRTLLNVSNEAAAHAFTEILLGGIRAEAPGAAKRHDSRATQARAAGAKRGAAQPPARAGGKKKK